MNQNFLRAAVLSLLFMPISAGYGASELIYKNARIEISSIHKQTKNPGHISQDGYEIPFFSIPAKEQPRYRFLMQSGLHGNERGAILFNAWIIDRIQNGKGPLSKLNQFATFDFIPIANPDGYLAKQRTNARQVNLNRNFSILFGKTTENPGKVSFSERETRAIKAILNKFHYTAAVDIHGYINWIVAPSNPHILGTTSQYSKTQLDNYKTWTSILQKTTKEQLPGYEYYTAGGLGDGGAFEDWAFWENNTFAFCLEVTPRNNPSDARFTEANMFGDYERFLFTMFSNAIQIQNENKSSALAANNH